MLKNILLPNKDLIHKIIKQLSESELGVIPTDTIYGIVGLALNPQTVEKIYKLRKRSSRKPMIILISSLDDLKKFDIKLTQTQDDFLKKIWPNPVSVILACPSKKFRYLHRGTNSLAFRVPSDRKLVDILKEVGPLVAPSANFEGEPPSQTVTQAKKYFGDQASFYVDGGKLESSPSTLIQLNEDGSWKILRQGDFKLV